MKEDKRKSNKMNKSRADDDDEDENELDIEGGESVEESD
jgi:hypothetical protein